MSEKENTAKNNASTGINARRDQLQNLLDRLVGGRLLALMLKETRQILRDKQQLFLLVFPPIVQICLYGFALSPDVQDLRLAIEDECKSYKSRELVSAIVENRVFKISKSPPTLSGLMQSIERGHIDAGLIIPPDFDRKVGQGHVGHVQLVIDAVDANTAGITQGYATQMIQQFAQRYAARRIVRPAVTETAYAYNPGLISAWFFVPGVLGLVLTLTGTLVSSVTLVKEKDSGTLEQLLMTPAESWEILVAKIVPLLIMLNGTVLLALTVSKLIFNLPFRGSFLLYMFVSCIYIFVVISIGIILATVSKNQRQAILTSFFFNLPLIQLSGALSPIESMPDFFRALTYLNPLRYYIQCVRNILLKGVGLDVMWRDILVLFCVAAVLLFFSAAKFRKQLS